mmetsp:Transcript_9624/g.19193  ORF Transcript_9624/g.19193 Transcript_9624/m.19193 type:complete len:211 (+) Transcript_9624:170-802(+)
MELPPQQGQQLHLLGASHQPEDAQQAAPAVVVPGPVGALRGARRRDERSQPVRRLRAVREAAGGGVAQVPSHPCRRLLARRGQQALEAAREAHEQQRQLVRQEVQPDRRGQVHRPCVHAQEQDHERGGGRAVPGAGGPQEARHPRLFQRDQAPHGPRHRPRAADEAQLRQTQRRQQECRPRLQERHGLQPGRTPRAHGGAEATEHVQPRA